MNDHLIVDLDLEFSLHVPKADLNLLDEIAEIMMNGAVLAVKARGATGIGFTYKYTHKKSRRGLTITAKKVL